MGIGAYHRLFTADGRDLEILDLRAGKNGVVIRFLGINDRNAAEALKGARSVRRPHQPARRRAGGRRVLLCRPGRAGGHRRGRPHLWRRLGGLRFRRRRPARAEGRRLASDAHSVLRGGGAPDRSRSRRHRRRPRCSRADRPGRIRTGEPPPAAAAQDRRQGRQAAVSFRATVLTLYPEMFPGHLGHSLSGRALERGDWTLETVQIRDFAEDRHRSVDDTPAGGGAGMVLKPDVLARAIDHAAPPSDVRPRLLMSPRGRPLTQARVREIAAGPGAVVVCGRFEGVDQRVIEARALEEVSVGDYVLSGGEPAALVLLDAVVRLLPGVMGNMEFGRARELRDRPAGAPALHPAADFRGPRHSGGADVRQSRRDRALAPGRGGAPDRRAAAGPAGAEKIAVRP